MTGADIIAAIILTALAIAIFVYLLHWLYRRSSKEVSFVRTGLRGETWMSRLWNRCLQHAK